MNEDLSLDDIRVKFMEYIEGDGVSVYYDTVEGDLITHFVNIGPHNLEGSYLDWLGVESLKHGLSSYGNLALIVSFRKTGYKSGEFTYVGYHLYGEVEGEFYTIDGGVIGRVLWRQVIDDYVGVLGYYDVEEIYLN